MSVISTNIYQYPCISSKLYFWRGLWKLYPHSTVGMFVYAYSLE